MRATLLLFLAAYAYGVDPKKSQAPEQIPSVQASPPVTPDFENRVASLFSENKCDELVKTVKPVHYPYLHPLLIAATAYCETDHDKAEEVFQVAINKAPSHELVALLHAHYVWMYDEAKAEPLWQRVILVARNPMIKKLAKEYIDGTIEKEEGAEQRLELGKKLTYFANLQAGGSFEKNPLSASLSDPAPGGNFASNNLLSLGGHYKTGFGSVASNYTLTYNKYFGNSPVDFIEQDLDLPITAHIGTNEDAFFRPYASYLHFGNSPLQFLVGLGVGGTAYRPDYKQSVQGAIYQDEYIPGSLQPQQGFHYRFEYTWEWFPGDFFVRFLTFIEHTKAASDSDSVGSFYINYSHNDIGVAASMEYNLKWIIFGFAPRLSMRLDDNDSVYVPQNSTDGVAITKRRNDYLLILQPNITIPLDTSLQLFIWYEWTENFSSMGANDYVNRNYVNQVVGVALKTYFASF